MFTIRSVLAIAVLATSGAQWSILQSVAWMNMTVDFSQEMSFGRALKKTFSGDFPCKICLMAKDVNDEGSSEPSLNNSQKHDWNTTAEQALLYPPERSYSHVSDYRMLDILFGPPAPPPPEFLRS